MNATSPRPRSTSRFTTPSSLGPTVYRDHSTRNAQRTTLLNARCASNHANAVRQAYLALGVSRSRACGTEQVQRNLEAGLRRHHTGPA
jgi:hypothetical protein